MNDLLRKQLAKRPLLDRLEGRARNMRAAGDGDTAALLDDAAAHVRTQSPAPDVRGLEAMPDEIYALPQQPCPEWEGTWHICEGAAGGIRYVRADLAPQITAEMVERAAREIGEHTYARCLPHKSDCNEWGDMDEADRNVYRIAARAALTAALATQEDRDE